MQKFQYLLKKRAKALSVFNAARDGLKNIETAIIAEIDQSDKRRSELKAQLEEETMNIAYLNEEMKSTRSTIEKLENVFA